jgi:hypothetical protein
MDVKPTSQIKAKYTNKNQIWKFAKLLLASILFFEVNGLLGS